jgi:hypothetical protein
LAQAETERLARAEGAVRPRDLMSANREDEDSMMVCMVYEILSILPESDSCFDGATLDPPDKRRLRSESEM